MTQSRRQFIQQGGMAVAASLMAPPMLVSNFESVTVGHIMDRFIAEVPGAPFPNTVDTLKAGDRSMAVTGIVTTMFATIELIRRSIDIGANFIIAHEPTFYNHLDQTDWLEDNDVYQYKWELLEKNRMAVWRNHDYVHSLQVDGVQYQVAEQLGWNPLQQAQRGIYQLPAPQSLRQLISHAKQRLHISSLRYIGDLTQKCQKILLMPGAAGGRPQIKAVNDTHPDVLICGEIAEWETAEYVRDARAKGNKTALIVLGHIASEEPGSLFMANWLKKQYPAIKTTHIDPGNSLYFL